MNPPALEPSAAGAGVPRLRRVLTLRDLIFYGIVAVTPSAPATVYGLAEVRSGGYVTVTILAAMVAMVLTAISYGRMAALYPSAGSAYAYVSRGIHPYLGFVAGWAMLLDYMLIPLFCTLYGTLSLQRALPMLPFPIGALFFAGGITLLNLRGIKSTALANQVLLVFMGVVLFSFIVLAIRYIASRAGFLGLFSVSPFYRPGTFHVRAIASATSFAALTYLGFDAVTTMAEDVINPRRNVLLAAVSVCIFTGLFGGLLVYLGHLVWPNYTTFTNIDTAFHRRHRPRRRGRSPEGDRAPAGRGQHRRRPHLAGGSGPPALRHGPRKRNPGALLCPPPPHSQHSRLQHHSAGCAWLHRRPGDQL